MKIPHNFQVTPIAAPRVRKVNDKTMQANAIQEQAEQGLVRGVNAAVQTGNEIYQDHIQKQYDTDMIAGSAMLDQLQFKRDSDIKKIPVDSSVDYAAEVKKINDNYNAQWKGWSKSNIRNQDHPTVRQLRQESIDAFENDGATSSARLGVQYEDARNISNIELAEGILASQLKADPYNAATVQKLQSYQDARLSLGAITEADATAGKAAIQSQAYKMADGQTMQTAEQFAYAGDYDAAAEVLDKQLSPEYSKDDRKDAKDKILGAGSYNRFNDMASSTNTVSGWKLYGEDLKDEKYMSAGNKKLLNSRKTKGLSVIEAGQKANLKRMVADSVRGDFDSTAYEIGAANDSRAGLSMVASAKVKNAMIENASLYTSAVQVKDDKRAFTEASKTGGIAEDEFDDILAMQLTGSMTEDQLVESMKDSKQKVKDGEWSAAVGRQMEREAMKAYQSSLEDDTAIRGIDEAWYRFDKDVPMPEQVVTVYKAVNDSLRRQNELLGGFVDATSTLSQIRTDMTEWVEQNPNASAADIQEQAKKQTDIINSETDRNLRIKNQ